MKTKMKTIVNFLVVMGFVMMMGNAPVHAVMIDFETLSDSDPVTTQFAGSGITFSNASVLTAGVSLNEFEFPPKSGSNVVFDDGGTMRLTLTTPMLSVGGFFTYLTPLTVTAFDGAGNIVGTGASHYNANLALSGDVGSSPNEFLQITSAGGISSFFISGDPFGSSFVLDDLTVTPVPGVTVPEPRTISLMMMGLLALFLFTQGQSTQKREWRKKAGLRCFVMMAAMLLGLSIVPAEAAKGFQGISVTPETVVVNTPTVLTVTVKPADDPDFISTGVRLLRLVGGTWQVVGNIVDDGTHGDALSHDKIFTGQITVNESGGEISLRATAAYKRTLRRTASAVATVSSTVVTTRVETPYMANCRSHGVPIPPDWAETGTTWVRQGALTTKLILPMEAAYVWTYSDPNRRGACIALPRGDGKVGTLAGIICQGARSGYACFWDNRERDNATPLGWKGVKLEISKLQDASNVTEICTECHRGDNVFC